MGNDWWKCRLCYKIKTYNNSKETLRLVLVKQRFPVRFRLLPMCRGELSAVMARLMSKCLWSGWKWLRTLKEIASPFPCGPVNRKCSWKKTQIENKHIYKYTYTYIYTYIYIYINIHINIHIYIYIDICIIHNIYNDRSMVAAKQTQTNRLEKTQKLVNI